MAKITLTDLSNLQNENTAVAAINANNTAVETAFENTLSRDGTAPNSMGASIDMDNHRLLNLPSPTSLSEPLRLEDLVDFVGGSLTLSSVPDGGTTGQALVKLSNANGDVDWATIDATTLGGLGLNVGTFLGTPTSANLALAVSDETGSGSLVFGTSPTLVTPSISSIVNTGTLTLPTSTDTLVGRATTDTLTNKSIDAANNTITNLNTLMFGANVIDNDSTLATNSSTRIPTQQAVKGFFFPSGTVMLFVQTSAPTGWTKVTAHNDKALRVVSGSAGSGGSNAFSTVMGQTVVGSTALTLAQIPPHSHSYTVTTISSGPNPFLDTGTIDIGTTGATTGSAGSGDAHTHTIAMNIAYVDVIMATKN